MAFLVSILCQMARSWSAVAVTIRSRSGMSKMDSKQKHSSAAVFRLELSTVPQRETGIYVEDQPYQISIWSTSSRKFVLDAITGEVLSNAKWDIPERSLNNQYLKTDRWIVFLSGKNVVRVDRNFKNSLTKKRFANPRPSRICIGTQRKQKMRLQTATGILPPSTVPGN